MPNEEPLNEQEQAVPKLEFSECTITLRVYPAVPLTKTKLAHQFSSSLSDYLKIEKTAFDDTKWAYEASFSGYPECKFAIVIQPEQLFIALRIPPKMAEEWIDKRFEYVLDEFKKTFNPQMVLGLHISTVGIMDTKSDARQFLAETLMRLPGLEQFERLVGLVGLRIIFPPFPQLTLPSGKVVSSDWNWEVKIESLATDANKLFLASTAQWNDGKAWAEAVPGEVITRLTIATDHLKRYVSRFAYPQTPNSDQENQ